MSFELARSHPLWEWLNLPPVRDGPRRVTAAGDHWPRPHASSGPRGAGDTGHPKGELDDFRLSLVEVSAGAACPCGEVDLYRSDDS
jgi:hypothetical protein